MAASFLTVNSFASSSAIVTIVLYHTDCVHKLGWTAYRRSKAPPTISKRTSSNGVCFCPIAPSASQYLEITHPRACVSSGALSLPKFAQKHTPTHTARSASTLLKGVSLTIQFTTANPALPSTLLFFSLIHKSTMRQKLDHALYSFLI